MSCGQWMGHVICLKGRPEQCADCVAVPLPAFSTPLSQTSSSSERHPTAQSVSQPRERPSTSWSNKCLIAQSASLSRKLGSEERKCPSAQPPSAEEKLFTAGKSDMCGFHTCVIRCSTHPSDSSHGDSELMTAEPDNKAKLTPLIPSMFCNKPMRGLCVSVPLKLHDQECGGVPTSCQPQCSHQSLHDSWPSGCIYLTNPPSIHPAVMAVAQRNRGMKVLSSVCIQRRTPQQLMYHYKQQKLAKTSREDTQQVHHKNTVFEHS